MPNPPCPPNPLSPNLKIYDRSPNRPVKAVCCETSPEVDTDFTGSRAEMMIQQVTHSVNELSAQHRELHQDISRQVSHLCSVLSAKFPPQDSEVLRIQASPRETESNYFTGAEAQGAPMVSRKIVPLTISDANTQAIPESNLELQQSKISDGYYLPVHAKPNGHEVVFVEAPMQIEECKVEVTKSQVKSPSGKSVTTSLESHCAPSEAPSEKSKTTTFSMPALNQSLKASWSMYQDLMMDPVTPAPDIEEGLWAYCRAHCLRIVSSHHFDEAIGIIIFVNAISIGWETQEQIEGDAPDFLVVLENVFLSIYIVEIAMRFMAFGIWSSLKQAWIVFDIFLVFLGALSSWVIEPYFEPQAGDGNAASDIMRPILVLRVLRLLRLLRALRLFQSFKYLWRLVQGLMSGVPTMASTAFLLIGTVYVFACIAVELITKNEVLRKDPEVSKIIEKGFASLPGTMLTLFQFATLDSIAGVYTPMIYVQPSLILFFFPVLLIVSIALMNLVTAVLVEASIDNSKVDREMQKSSLRRKTRKLIPEIEAAFNALDTSGDGVITKQEVSAASGDLPAVITNIVKPESMQELFDMLDVDGSGKVESEEFVQGIVNLAISDVSIETQQALKLLRIIRRQSEETDKRMKKIEQYVRDEHTPVSRDSSLKRVQRM